MQIESVKELMKENCSDCDKWKMAAEMVAADDAFFTQYDDVLKKHDPRNPQLCLLMNDVWSWATADGENVHWDEIPAVYEIWKKHGWDGMLIWACKRRNARPQKPLFDKLKPEIQEQLKDLPRAGDAVVPVGGGKVAVFDDGWGEKKLIVEYYTNEKYPPVFDCDIRDRDKSWSEEFVEIMTAVKAAKWWV